MGEGEGIGDQREAEPPCRRSRSGWQNYYLFWSIFLAFQTLLKLSLYVIIVTNYNLVISDARTALQQWWFLVLILTILRLRLSTIVGTNE